MAMPQGVLLTEPQNKPLSPTGQVQAGAYRKFFLTGTLAVAPVYQDGALVTTLSQVPGQAQPSCTADGNGRFNPIYLDPKVIYRAQLFNAANSLQEDVDPYVPAPTPGIFLVQKPAPTSRSNTTVVANDPDLVLTIPGPGTWRYELSFNVSTAGATGVSPGLNFGIAYTGGLAGNSEATAFAGGNLNNVAYAGQILLNTTTVGNLLLGANGVNSIYIRGILTALGGGVLSLQWAQATSNATATTVNSGSVTAQRLN